MKGLFITLEGPDGSGKTTIAKKIQTQLETEGYEVVYTREPGGIRIAEDIREIILDKQNTAMDARCEALLYAASRRQHLVEKVFPALKEGKIVLCDRFIDSSLVYQGMGRGIGIDEVYEMNLFAIGDMMPQLTLFFDVPPAIGLSRIELDQNREVNRLDLETLEFHQKVYEGYKYLETKYPERIVRVDATPSIEDVYEQALKIVRKQLCIKHI